LAHNPILFGHGVVCGFNGGRRVGVGSLLAGKTTLSKTQCPVTGHGSPNALVGA